MTAAQPRCPSRITHESGVILACMLNHQGEPTHWAARHANQAHRATWNDDDDRVITDWPIQPATAYTAEQAVVDLETLHAGGPVIDRAMRDAGFLPDEPHHAAARERTDDEQAALEPKYATGGFVESGVDGDNPPPWLKTCAYDRGGFLPLGLAAYRNDTGRAYVLDGGMPDPSLIPGMVEVPAEPTPPTDGACCQAAYYSDGFAHDHEVTR